MKGGAGDEDQHYGRRILDAVRRVGLPLKLDKQTIGDGNCWHRAIIQQSHRVSLGIVGLTSHADLRERVCQLALRAELQVIKEMKKNWVQKEPWSAYWERMKRNKVWADHPFIQVTAWLLERDIFVVTDSASPENLFMTFSGSREGREKPCPQAPLLIGNDNNQHFQSLLPEDEESFHPSQFGQWTPEEISKAVSEIVQKQKIWEKQQQKKGQEQPQPATSKQDDTIGEKRIFSSTPDGPSVEVAQEAGCHKFKCLHCFTHQKQIPSHMRKVHHSRFSHRVLEEFGEMWKVFAHNLAESRRKNKRKAEDLEGFKENHQKEEAARKSRRRLEDLEGFKEKDRNGAANYKAKRRKEDLEGFKENHRKQEAKHKAKKKDEDPEKFKQEQNKWNAKQRLNAENTYLKEVRWAAIFPCVCCHTLNFRQQVVEFTGKQAESIQEKAFAVYQRQEVIKTTSS